MAGELVLTTSQALERPMLLGVPPATLVDAAREVADTLKQVIKEQELSVDMGQGGEHVKIEGWLTAGALLQVFPHVISTEAIWVKSPEGPQTLYGFKAVAEARTVKGDVVATASSMCTRDETQKIRRGARAGQTWERWREAPAFQLMSMAETRAASKVMGFALRWVITLAGYSGTPAEEVDPEAQAHEREYLEGDPELRRTVLPEGERPRRERPRATGRAQARRADPSRPPSEEEATPRAIPWATFLKEFPGGEIQAAQAVAMLRTAFPTALAPEEGSDEAKAYERANDARKAEMLSAKLFSLPPDLAVEAQHTITEVAQGNRPEGGQG